MEDNNIMLAEEMEGMTEELATGGSRNGLKIAAGVAGVGLLGFLAYKLGKHIKAKIDAKKEQAEEDVIHIDSDEYEVIED